MPLLALALSMASTLLATPVTLIKAGTLVDTTRGVVLKDQEILVEGNKILAVGPHVDAPAGAKVVDLSDSTVLPGLFDCHTHLLTNFQPSVGGDDENANLQFARQNTTTRALVGARNARECLEAGITTVRECGNCGVNGDIYLRDAINAGYLPGPRILASTQALSSPGGQFGRMPKEVQVLVAGEYREVGTPEEARKATRAALADGADLIKVIVDTFPLVLTTDDLKMVVAEAHRVKRKVAAHAVTQMAVDVAIEAGVDSIEHGYRATDDQFKRMADAGIFLVATVPPAEYFFDLSKLSEAERKGMLGEISDINKRGQQQVARAKKAGVKVAAGSDDYYEVAGFTRGTASLGLLLNYRAAGLSSMEVLQSATTVAADLCGVSNTRGSIEAGKWADIVAVKGNLIENFELIQKIDWVMKSGQVVRGR